MRHYDKDCSVRFVTFSCYKRYRLFSKAYIYELFSHHLKDFRTRHNIQVLGYVIMPHHVHLVIYPTKEIELGKAIGRLKSRFSYEMIRKWKKEGLPVLNRLGTIRRGKEVVNFWQPRCYDHNCRSLTSVREKINYCHMNPVRAGLVKSPSEWKWSSYNWYRGDRDGIVYVDEVELG